MTHEALEALSRKLADLNLVEDAWTVTGLADRMCPDPRYDDLKNSGEYEEYYLEGYMMSPLAAEAFLDKSLHQAERGY